MISSLFVVVCYDSRNSCHPCGCHSCVSRSLSLLCLSFSQERQSSLAKLRAEIQLDDEELQHLSEANADSIKLTQEWVASLDKDKDAQLEILAQGGDVLLMQTIKENAAKKDAIFKEQFARLDANKKQRDAVM